MSFQILAFPPDSATKHFNKTDARLKVFVAIERGELHPTLIRETERFNHRNNFIEQIRKFHYCCCCCFYLS